MPFNSPTDELETSAPMSPSALHAAMFGERSRIDSAKLSLAQQSLAARRSAAIEAATMKRAHFAAQIQRNISSAAAAEKMFNIDPSSKSFEKQVSSVLTDHPEALSSPGFMKVLQDRRADRANFVKSETPEILSNPYASKAFENSYEQTGSPVLAQNAAKAQLNLFNQATKLISSPHLGAEDISKFYNPQSGEYNLDQAAINQGQIKHDTAEQSVKFTNENKTSHDEAWKLLSTLNKTAPLDTTLFPAAGKSAADRTPAEQAANNAAWNAFKQLTGQTAPTAAAPSAPKASDEVARLLGTSAPPAPAAAPTPSQVAASTPGGDELAAAEKTP